jgi:hypothetical protein
MVAHGDELPGGITEHQLLLIAQGLGIDTTAMDQRAVNAGKRPVLAVTEIGKAPAVIF